MHSDSFVLNNQSIMPSIGLGTFKMRKEDEVMRAVDVALATGYRLFDTAAEYRNEVHLKKAFMTLLPKYNLTREDLFITSKLSPSEMYSKNTVKNAYRNTLKNLGVEYLDLYLIHFPGLPYVNPKSSTHKTFRNIAWSALMELYDENLVNAIGVSNFTTAHLEELVKEKHRVIPAVNQVEWHPYFYDDELLMFCRQHNIWLQGYSPFGGPNSNGTLLQEPIVKTMAAEMGATVAQILLSWSLHSQVATIPKSTNPEHIRTNFTFDVTLSNEQIKILNKLNTGKKFAWNPYPFL